MTLAELQSFDLAAAWRPYIETCIESFGPQRAMFESNFPVDQATCSYAVLWNTFKRITARYGEDEKDALFSGTAVRVYGLRIPALARRRPGRAASASAT